MNRSLARSEPPVNRNFAGSILIWRADGLIRPQLPTNLLYQGRGIAERGYSWVSTFCRDASPLPQSEIGPKARFDQLFMAKKLRLFRNYRDFARRGLPNPRILWPRVDWTAKYGSDLAIRAERPGKSQRAKINRCCNL